MGRGFNEYWRQVQENGDLTILEIKESDEELPRLHCLGCEKLCVCVRECVCVCLCVCVWGGGWNSLHQIFPEASFIRSACSFLFPPCGKHQIVDMQIVVEQFNNKYLYFNAVWMGLFLLEMTLLEYLYDEKCKEIFSASGGDNTENMVGFV